VVNTTCRLALSCLAVAVVLGNAQGHCAARPEVDPAAPAVPISVSVRALDAPPRVQATLRHETGSESGATSDAAAADSQLEAEEKEADPEDLQKEALDLCQSAAELLRSDDREPAINAVDRAYQAMLSLPDDGTGASLRVKDDIRQVIAKLLREAYGKSTVPPPPSWDLGIPMVDNEHVRREIQSFTTVEREMFIDAYRRSGRYRPMIVARLEAARLPSQLSWLPIVESWFKVRAFSRAGAMGLWQFIASTGLRYGMRRDAWTDERMAPEKSTDAAIAYLADLHALFGDWPKALAAYNCGEGRVLRAQGRRGDQYLDFWDLYEQLPRETRRYFPRLIATLLIIQHPGRYGMKLPEPPAPREEPATVRVARSVSLEALDQALGLSRGTLGELNPELRFASTPGRDYELRIPAERVDAAAATIAQLPDATMSRRAYVTHRVRRGETLRTIARQYSTTATAIRGANGLRHSQPLRVGQRLRIAVRG
jgi:membrane-bound lytic murein transglycosylase D